LAGASDDGLPGRQEKSACAWPGRSASRRRLSSPGRGEALDLRESWRWRGWFAEDPGGWRGALLFAVAGIDASKALVATDPVIANGEMVAEYHECYGSAATMLVPALHRKLQRPAGE